MQKKILLILIFIIPLISEAQFLDNFDGEKIEDWFYFTGDGDATMDFVQNDGYSSILVDATNDKHNVWWAIIKRNISPLLKLKKLKKSTYELRVEARVRISDAPRRVHFMINTNRTTNFHKHLLEYDIEDNDWHTISMTTKDLDAVPGDSLFVQLGATDFGLGTYKVDIDYYKADIIDVRKVKPDLGEPLMYHPPVLTTSSYDSKLVVAHDAIINSDFPNVNFNDWYSKEAAGNVPVLSVARNQWPVLRWDFSAISQEQVDGAGLLELTTHSFAGGGDYVAHFGKDLGVEFGKVSVVEILVGDDDWTQDSVTYNSLLEGDSELNVFNGQMIFDAEVVEHKNGKNYITISRPVMQRLLSGKTKGLVIKPLGLVNISFFASEYDNLNMRPKLFFNLK